MYKPHIKAAHEAWKKLVQPGDCVIDATCGNGHDTLLLATLALTTQAGSLYAFDIQPTAIQNTKLRLQSHLSPEQYNRVKFIQRCHSTFPTEIKEGSVRLITYNLGYLPGAEKSLTTITSTTLQSISQALKLLMPEGAISITCYPGHPEGQQEEKAILEFASSLNPKEWLCCHQAWINRLDSPSLLSFIKIRTMLASNSASNCS